MVGIGLLCGGTAEAPQRMCHAGCSPGSSLERGAATLAGIGAASGLTARTHRLGGAIRILLKFILVTDIKAVQLRPEPQLVLFPVKRGARTLTLR